MNHELLRALLALIAGLCLLPPTAAAGPSRADEILDEMGADREARSKLAGEAANASRGEAMELLLVILDEQTLPPLTRAEMLMRLGELQFEQSRYEALREMEELDARYTSWDPDTEPEPQLDRTRSLSWMTEAIGSYRSILADYPSYPRLDEVVFFLGFALDEIGKGDDALMQYRRLVKQHPESAFVPDAWFAIGEYYFERDNAFRALPAYERASEFTGSRLHTLALYKMAWCFYNVGEFGAGIDTLQEVIRETDRLAATDGAPISLREEALRDLVVFLVEEGDLEDAVAVIGRYALDAYARELVRKLGDLHLDRGEHEVAIAVWRRLIADAPDAPDNPVLQRRVVDSLQRRDRFEEADAELDRMVARYGADSGWVTANVDNPEARAEAERLLEDGLRSLAVEAHQQALRRRSAKLLALARDAYARYLAAFPEGHDSYEVRFWFAEVLYKLGRYEAAAEQYEAVVVAGDGRFLKDAAANTIFAVQEALVPIQSRLDREAAPSVRRSGDALQEVELHPLEARLVAACDTHARLLPEDDRTLKFLYKAALLLHDRNRFNESNERFLAIVRADPGSSMAEHGIHTILRSYEEIENWSGLARAADEFLGDPGVVKTRRFEAELRSIQQRATFKVAEGHGAAGDHARAAAAFRAFWQRFEDSDVRDVALFNAAHHLDLAGDAPAALELRLAFVQSYPEPLGRDARDARLYEKSLALLGSHYASVAAWDEAAARYRELFDADPDFAEQGYTSARDAIYDAGLFAEAMGDVDRAARDLGDFARLDGVGPADRLEARMRVARLLLAADRSHDARVTLQAVVADPEAEASFDLLMEAWLLLGGLIDDRTRRDAHHRAGLRRFAERAGSLPESSAARVSAAEMRFLLLERRFEEFDAMPVTGSPAEARRGLARRSAALEALREEYVEVVELKQGEWGIAALYRIGTLYADLANDLVEAPCPPRLTEDQCLIYEARMIDEVQPLVGEAVKHFLWARDRSHELGLYTEYTRATLDELTRARPEEYPPHAERLPVVGYVAGAFTTSSLVE